MAFLRKFETLFENLKTYYEKNSVQFEFVNFTSLQFIASLFNVLLSLNAVLANREYQANRSFLFM